MSASYGEITDLSDALEEQPLASSTQIYSPYPDESDAPVPPALVAQKSITRGNILFFFGVLLLLTLAYKLLKELEILYVSALFAVVLMPAVNKICSLKIGSYRPSRAVGIIVLFVAVIATLGLFFFFAMPPVFRDAQNFAAELPRRVPAAVSKLKSLKIANEIGLDNIAAKTENFLSAAGAYVVTAIPGWLAHVFDLLTAAFLCIYFMLEGEHVYNFFLSLFASTERRRLDVTMQKAEVKMSKWLYGQGLLMLILGTLSTIVFGFLHVRYFFLLGVLMGLFNISPIAGGVITILLAGIVAAFDSWAKMAGVFLFYAIYINVENAVLTPRIMKSSVDLMGITVLVALLIGTALAGIVGALVAVPTAALVAVLLEEYAVQR